MMVKYLAAQIVRGVPIDVADLFAPIGLVSLETCTALFFYIGENGLCSSRQAASPIAPLSFSGVRNGRAEMPWYRYSVSRF